MKYVVAYLLLLTFVLVFNHGAHKMDCECDKLKCPNCSEVGK